MSGAQGESFFLDTNGAGTWTPGPSRDLGLRDYAPSVMYDTGKVIFMGGGLTPARACPPTVPKPIDLTAADPAWHPTSPMHFRRRQHNATILPDGTVLVTGGTQGPNFNDVDRWFADPRGGAVGPGHGHLDRVWPRRRSTVAITRPPCCCRMVACSVPAAASMRPRTM